MFLSIGNVLKILNQMKLFQSLNKYYCYLQYKLKRVETVNDR